MTILEHLDFAR